MVGCVGLCFAQFLWYRLRQTALPIKRIEQLFSIRSNPFLLANPKILWTTPLLFSMAVYLWFIELASVYPPGALTVASVPYWVEQNVNMPVINQPVAKIFDPWQENGTYPLLSEIWNETSRDPSGFVKFWYMMPRLSLTALSKFMMSTGDIVDLSPPRVGQNVSYTMQFRGPQVSCVEQVTNITQEGDFNQVAIFNTTWDSNHTFVKSVHRYVGYFTESNHSNFVGDIFHLPDEEAPKTFLAIEQTQLRCDTFSMLYNLNISYERGVQQIKYSLTDAQPLQLRKRFFAYSKPGRLDLPDISGKDFAQWPEVMKKLLESWSVFAIVDALLLNMKYSWINQIGPEFANNASTSIGEWKLDNGTVVKLAGVTTSDILGKNSSSDGTALQTLKLLNPPTLLQDSIFDPLRFANDQPINHDASLTNINWENPFDPRQLNISEPSLNALLTNLTISSLSLGVDHADIPVTVSDHRNTYTFSDKVNFFVPYALCLGVALCYVGVGIWALLANGVPATDGGFLQIMMATRGRTEMEELVLREGLVGTSDLSRELLGLRIRFGELVEVVVEDGGGEGLGEGEGEGEGGEASPVRVVRKGTITFGTEGETVPLRRRGTGLPSPC
ncbi:uncharacterized protein EI97DRAFT_434264 [Westerdykella ornata]|uniref:Uncharacterized protein n=1 Tax=Westerdykella ornata TaxID=318751 RepID=A0A6A6JGV4_WESOR|nr:uncharacterized protein EI97DRAFT_434264 [Westerdykella ornata]KAF2275424.1 hypothetical protein EI97DRAFT_434264 [Westerdykella ornata]